MHSAVSSPRTRTALVAAAICAAFAFTATQSHAATIMKLSLGSTADVATNPSGVFSTTDDGVAITPGDQQTAIDFNGLLAGIPDVTTPIASVSLNNLTPVGPAAAFGPLAIQSYTGGTFNVYDEANTLLLSAVLNASTLTGTIGAPGTGSVFTTSSATITGGVLAPSFDPNSLSLSMDLINVNNGAGFSVSSNTLQPFTADASLTIAADPAVGAPEPATLSLALLAAPALLLRRRKK
jgi:hypothetical protein